MSGALMSTLGTLGVGKTIIVTELAKTTATTSSATNLTSGAISMVAGRIYVVMMAWDPSGASVPTVTLSDGANTYTALSTLYPAPATTSAGTGSITQTFTTTAGTSASRTISATFSAAISSKAMIVIELQNATTTQRNTVTTSRGTTWTNYNTPSGNVGDLILVVLGQEDKAPPTSGSTSTTGGTWSTVSTSYITSGAAASAMGVAYQYKVLTATGAQTNAWTLGGNGNWGSQSFALQAA